jgi:hypothetical protein
MIIKNQIPILKKLEFITFESLIYHFKSMFMSILDKKSPFEYLFNLKLDYSFLKIFHCLYFLWIYNRHKINFHSLNVFILVIIPLVWIINVSIFLHERFMWLGIFIFLKLFSHLHMLIRSKLIFSIFFMSNDYNPFTPFTTYLPQTTCDHKLIFANIYHNTF